MVSYPGFTFLSVLMDDTVVIATDDDTVHAGGDTTEMTRDTGRMTLRSSR